MIFGKHINKYYLRYSWALVLGVLSLIMVDFMQLKVPEFYRMTVNGLNGETQGFTMDYLLDKICLPLVFVILSLIIGRFIWRMCFFGTALRVETNIRSEMFDHAKDLSQRFYGENKVGDLMSLFTNDLQTVEECFGSGVLMFFDAVTLGFMAFYKMFRMNAMLTLFSLIPMVLLFTMSTIVGKQMTKRWDARQAAFSRLSDFSQESFSGIHVIKAFTCELRELLAFKKLNRDNENANVSYVRVSTLLNIMVTLFVESVFCVIFGYGGYLVSKKVFNAGQMVEFIGYFNSVIWPVMAVSQLIDQTSRGRASLARITKLLEEDIDVCDGENVKEPEKDINGRIEFKNLTFTYPGAITPSLENVSFTIENGESVGIIGKTGSGKSTVCDLLMRTYNVPSDTLFVGGIDVNEMPIDYLRKHLAYVPQDNFLFSDTITNNIAFACDEKSEEEAAKYAMIAGVSKDIEEFTNKYKTVLGERGVTVSGGQKQRISIARALMKNAPILVLDDAVSAVDTDTEKRILSLLGSARDGMTTIMVAHRVSTIKNMDKIIYMEDGRIVATGTHDELLEISPEYNKMVKLQELEDKKAGDFNA